MKLPVVLLLQLLMISINVQSFILNSGRGRLYRCTSVLTAKKIKPKGKGFGSEKVVTNNMEDATSDEIVPSNDNELSSEIIKSKPSTSKSGDAIDTDAIFTKYGISDKKVTTPKKSAPKPKRVEDAAFGESVLEKIPEKTQVLIDNILVTITFSALLFVVSSGVGISISAVKIVFPEFGVNEGVDEIIKNFLSPAFTPALVFFLLCSSTFGLFKYAQISSSKTVYKEQ
eukprot:gene4662-9248_t